MWPFRSKKGSNGFSCHSTAEVVTEGIDGSRLTAIVTGASSGIGAETCRVLALRGVHIIMGVRNISAGLAVKESILEKIPNAKIDILELDLASIESVKKFASDFNSSGLPLNILINNAGIGYGPFKLSKNGIELIFATNHLGHFLLTELLLENLKGTANESGVEGRIVIISSLAHKMTFREGIRFEKINDPSGHHSIWSYGQSKLANILHANELSRILKEQGANVTVNSLHPGAIVTNIFRDYVVINGLVQNVGKYFMKNVQQGAATTCYVALHPDVNGVSGKYFSDSNSEELNGFAVDQDMAKKLWSLSLKMIESVSS